MALTGSIYDKSFELADRCVALYKVLQRNREYNLSNYLNVGRHHPNVQNQLLIHIS